MHRRVLITGATGFVGQYVAREYANQGWYVIGVGSGELTEYGLYGLSECYRCKITVDALIKYAVKVDIIIHCAGGGLVANSYAEPYQNFIKNVDTTAQILEFIRLHSPKTKFFYPSSAAVYGEVNKFPIAEDAPLNPISPYGFHKKMAESLCELYAEKFEVSVVIVRLFSIYGNGLRKQLLWDACQKFKQSDNIFFGTGNEFRDWLHVEDVAKLFLTLSLKPIKSFMVLNAGSGVGVSIKDVLIHINDLLALDLKPQFSSLRKIGDPKGYIADTTKVNSLNWSPTINWQEGVADYVKWHTQCL